MKNCLIGVVVPDPETIHQVLEELNIPKDSMNIAEICARFDVKKLILDDIVAVGKKAGLFTFEQVKIIIF